MSEFCCGLCSEIFQKSMTDESAIIEYNEKFPDGPPIGEETTLICDDCWQCCRPDIDEDALEDWRDKLHLASVGTKVMVRFFDHPILRRGIINKNDPTCSNVCIGNEIVYPSSRDMFPIKDEPISAAEASTIVESGP